MNASANTYSPISIGCNMANKRFSSKRPTLAELQAAMGYGKPYDGIVNPPAFMSETPRAPRTNRTDEKLFMNALFKMSALTKGLWLRKNSNGIARSMNGQHVIKYGLGAGVSDGVGYYSRVVTQADVGKPIAVFVAVEGKLTDGGRVSPAQQAFIDQVNADGGIGLIAYDGDGVESVIEKIKKA